MKINVKHPPYITCGQRPIKKWFAWYPVWTGDGYIIWLQDVWLDKYVTQLGSINEYSLNECGQKLPEEL